ncbi:MAG: hypothetical protein CUN48_06885 [Candidatus Thermofonsia Clade 3 bacterium]|jgi:glycogen debranching enzyme|uniref:Glycogen debranching enzyme C-terminal domain-containing protein n=1 Tax=Candidatus Thermofonsia Clade 3 bacterium TaxID=2364212 RepID=A0A2M8QDD1_9CHLR|nr:hypothetical protein [Candidatus Roseilinea sp. NK_OTU-006]PJF47800.1 MAG: hypothetical protein CUN48_06885 [Candidatus Thermofonsia Clade 3 bacterium]
MNVAQFKSHRLTDPIAICGDRVYSICNQHGLFPDSEGGHVPGEMWGVWNHPIKLLDGFWFGISDALQGAPRWLSEARECRAYPAYVEFEYRFDALTIIRQDCAPDGVEGMLVTLIIRAAQPFDVSLHALFRSDLRPAWLGERAGMRDDQDGTELVDASARCVFTDAANPWACVVGADLAPIRASTGNLWAVEHTPGQGTSVHFVYRVRAEALADDGGYVQTVRFAIAGSAASRNEALTTHRRLLAHHEAWRAAKQAQCNAILETSQLITPDTTLNQAAAWSKLINQMFVREVPGIGRGVGAGLPEYPWWFGIDPAYATLPMLQSGQFELVRDTLRLLRSQSERHNPGEPGRVIHELSTTDVVFNVGNMVETPAFTRAVHQCWLWTGDDDFLREMYPFCRAGLLDYALGAHDPDGDLCPSGRSIVETVEMHAGFETVDVAAYTWDALVRLADMAWIVHPDDDAKKLRNSLADKAAALARCIRESWWLEDEGLFADVRARVPEVERTLAELEQKAREEEWLELRQEHFEAARRRFAPYLARYADAPRDVDLPWLLRHWVTLCPLEVGIATPEQACRALARLQSEEFCNPWGMYLHPDRHDVMSINTGLLALAAARYGYADQALAIVSKLTRAFSYRTPGAVSEALPGDWCFLQLWSNVGLVSPAIECFLGIQPRAAERTITITPNLPTTWDWAEVRRLRIGDTHFDIRIERLGADYRVRVSGDDRWRIESPCRIERGALGDPPEHSADRRSPCSG